MSEFFIPYVYIIRLRLLLTEKIDRPATGGPAGPVQIAVVGRSTDRIHHRRFDDLVQLLQPGDVLVVNDTAVIPARIMGRKATGGRVEVLLLSYPGENILPNSGTITFQCLLKASKRPAAGTQLIL